MLFGRLAGRVGLAGTAAVGVGCYCSDDFKRTVAVATIGSFCRLVMRSASKITLHDEHHFHSCLERPKGVGLLTVSNHKATCDDPGLIAAIVPPRLLLRGSSEMRWATCAKDVCFKPGSWLNVFADAAKTLPVVRGGGVWQPELDAMVESARPPSPPSPRRLASPSARRHAYACPRRCALPTWPVSRFALVAAQSWRAVSGSTIFQRAGSTSGASRPASAEGLAALSRRRRQRWEVPREREVPRELVRVRVPS